MLDKLVYVRPLLEKTFLETKSPYIGQAAPKLVILCPSLLSAEKKSVPSALCPFLDSLTILS